MHQSKQPLEASVIAGRSSSDEFIDLDALLAAARRRVWLVALFGVLGLVLGGFYLLVTPSIYTASTRILIDEDQAKFTQEEAPVSNSMQIDSMILSQVEILKSNELARTVVKAENLQENEAFLNPPKAPMAWLKSTIKSAIRIVMPAKIKKPDPNPEASAIGKAAALLQQNMSASRVGRSFVLEVSFKGYDAQLAGAITRAYAEAYLSDQLEANFDATQRATMWLQSRLEDLKQSSQQAAMEVEQFKAENGLTSTGGELISNQQLSDLNKELALARSETADARARYEQFKAIIDGGMESAARNATIPPDQPNSAAINEMKSRFLSVSSRLEDVVSRYGEDHKQAVALQREKSELERQIFRELEQLTESYRNDYNVAKAREESLSGNVGTMSEESSETGKALVKLRDLEQKSAALNNLYQNYLERYEEASQQRSLPIAKARVISKAENPVGPSSPSTTMTLAFALFLGLFAGAGAGTFQEFRERFFRTGEDVRNALGLRFLGFLPFMDNPPSIEPAKTDDSGQKSTAAIAPGLLRLTKDAPDSFFAETVRSARLAVDRYSSQEDCKVIGFVSALPDEGKTTVAANFACLLAASGAKTLLIDGDLRNRGLSRRLQDVSGDGIAKAINGEKRWSSFVRIDRSTGLAILPALGRHRGHSSELLAGKGMQQLIEEARQMFQYIVIDLPPMGPVIDASAFEPMADGFVAVAKWGATPRALLASTLKTERKIASKTIGVILNMADLNKLSRYTTSADREDYIDRYGAYYGGTQS